MIKEWHSFPYCLFILENNSIFHKNMLICSGFVASFKRRVNLLNVFHFYFLISYMKSIDMYKPHKQVCYTLAF